MSQTTIECTLTDGFVSIKIEGDFKLSTLYCLCLLLRRHAERNAKMVVIDVPGTFAVSNQVKRLRRKLFGCPSSGITVVVTGQKQNTKELNRILSSQIM